MKVRHFGVIGAVAMSALLLGCGGDGGLGPGEGEDPGFVLDDGSSGDPAFTLTWSHDQSDEGPDIDMWVRDPKGQILSTSRDGYSLGPTPEGGAIDRDDLGAHGGGTGGGPERTYWRQGSAPSGTYTYGVRYYQGEGTADYTLRVYVNGDLVATKTGSFSSPGSRVQLGQIDADGSSQDLLTMAATHTQKFTYCQDLAYAAVNGTPPVRQFGESDKGSLFDDMTAAGYGLTQNGYVPSSSDGSTEGALSGLQDGDIIMLAFDGPVDERNAPHYAVVHNGGIHQIVHWTQPASFGELDGPRPASFFFTQRTLTNPSTGTQYTLNRIYKYYKVFRK